MLVVKQIDFIFRTVLAELAQRIAEAPESEFDTEGRFVPVAVKGRRYWYFDWRGACGGKVRKYVGPDDNETVRQTVVQFRELKRDAGARRKIVIPQTIFTRSITCATFHPMFIQAVAMAVVKAP